ncbi:MAG: hypothetical protein M3R49_03705 [Chloroflexota bacterium]|nr:hypothetical protein [Chloroflexota bacterium]
MSTATTPGRVVRVDSLSRLAGHEYSLGCICEGLVSAATDLPIEAFKGEGLFPDDGVHPVMQKWYALLDEAVDEVAVQVADLLDAALAKRLPWEAQR